ncbi:hypothetical protein CQA57_03420 [Helicobacter anseris]|uniref:Abortive infection protein-like C-terminal domain-containing protein n=1 Tax=Helicobacter anseris TaxID=375926 RepID=A0A3D8J929_9HELI|nr:hypothetical protein [Helicobacter anseris]RDU74009.1 hypothetical protein CQA57_03420 [Helicobacter anseris]
MIFDNLPSRRKKIENGTLYPDIYQYDEVSQKLRNIIVRLFDQSYAKNFSHQIHTLICDEHGLFQLYKLEENACSFSMNYFGDIANFICLFKNEQLEIFLDLLTIIFHFFRIHDQKILQELNQRMLENGFGYQFENDTLIRIDSLPMHKNVVKPTLELLQDSRFENANVEYRQAFDDCNHRRYEEMFVNLCKSAESTIKIICDINKFELPKSSTLSSLTETLKNNNFLPNYSTESLNGLAKVLNTIGNIRNNNGGHGTGVEKRKIDQSFITYAMHSTASTLLFLLQRQKEWESK